MPLLFRRKTTDLEAATDVSAEPEPAQPLRKGYTPSKRELGQATPKRPSAQPRRATATPATKEEARQRRRELRAESAAEYRREGGPRDRGPERALVRDIVDSRRTVGTWFFVGALVVVLGSNPQIAPVSVQMAANALWALLALAVVFDSVLICRRIKKLVRQRFPNTGERLGSLYLYAVMRSITFRRMRVPSARVKIGDKV